MHDKNGKKLSVGDDISTYMHSGLLTITEINTVPGGDGYLQAKNDQGGSLGYDLATCKVQVSKVRSWKEMAQEALQVQDACNLSGVVHSFSAIITEVRTRLEAEKKGGTDRVNIHPVCVLYSDKIAHLTGTQHMGDDKVSDAYRWAYDVTQKK